MMIIMNSNMSERAPRTIAARSRSGFMSACLIAVSTFLWQDDASAAESVRADGKLLLARYAAIEAKLKSNKFGAPIYLESSEQKGSSRVDVYGVFDHGFKVVRQALQSPANWCDIMPTHINIKACTYDESDNEWRLTLYSGRKFYQPPADAFRLILKFHLAEQQADHLAIALTADHGPLGTTDHQMTMEATPLGPEKSFVHFGYSYRYGMSARVAIKTYLATLGREKVGFSTSTSRKTGRPVPIQGVRGSVERNAVRYYLAILTYLDALRLPAARRFEERIARWYTLTARYPRQLYEMPREEYLAMKKRERGNQLRLQRM